jgi:hypothetical protein
LVVGCLRELALKRLGDASVKRTSGLAKKRPVSRILYKRVLKQIARVRRRALAKQQTCRD